MTNRPETSVPCVHVRRSFHGPTPGHSQRVIQEPTAVGEGVGSGIDDSHHHHRAREFEDEIADDPAHAEGYLRLAKHAIGKAYFKPSAFLMADCSAAAEGSGPKIK